MDFDYSIYQIVQYLLRKGLGLDATHILPTPRRMMVDSEEVPANHENNLQ
jgi:hypothetical protein